MHSEPSPESIHTRFWREVAERDNPFAAALCHCAGYDVYGDILGKAGWIEYLYLLFHGERPSPAQAKLFDTLAVAIANPGPRDNSVRAAMSGGAGGSTLASCLMAALAAGAGNSGGARDVYQALRRWEEAGKDPERWREHLSRWDGLPNPGDEDWRPPAMEGGWPAMEHPPGFDPHGRICPTPVRQTLECLAAMAAAIKPEGHLVWLWERRLWLEQMAGLPLAMSGVAAAALADLDFDPQQGEMLYLLLRLPGAAAHGLEQHWRGNRDFPFYRNGINLTNDPGPA